MPVRRDGGYDLGEVEEWHAREGDRRKRRTALEPSSKIEPESVAGERYRAAKAELEELKLAERRGELMPAADVEDMFAGRAIAWKRQLENFCRRMAPIVLGCATEKEVHAALWREMRRILEEWSRR